MKAHRKFLAGGTFVALALTGCGGSSISRADFIKDFTDGFGSSTGIAEDKIACVGGKVYDTLGEDALKELDEKGLAEGAEPPQEVKDAFGPAFAACLEIGDILNAAGTGATAGLDVECISNTVNFTEADEEAFWQATLNDEDPPSKFSDEIGAAAVSCATG